jgi:hypothetical protein
MQRGRIITNEKDAGIVRQKAKEEIREEIKREIEEF